METFVKKWLVFVTFSQSGAVGVPSEPLPGGMAARLKSMSSMSSMSSPDAAPSPIKQSPPQQSLPPTFELDADVVSVSDADTDFSCGTGLLLPSGMAVALYVL